MLDLIASSLFFLITLSPTFLGIAMILDMEN